MPLVARPDDAGCLVFDWDGTLVDSTSANYQALARTLAGYGIPLDEDWYRARTGMSSDEMIEVLSAGALDAVAVSAERDALFLQSPDAVRELSAVAGIARAFHGRVPLVVASGGSGPVIRATMRTLGLDGLFDAIVTREDVRAGKPEPDIFLLAAERVGVPPERCLVYEDSDEGLLAAARAGMPAIDVRPWRYGRLPPASIDVRAAPPGRHDPLPRHPAPNRKDRAS
ncbi:HAD family hydrolase [Cryptosporangium aurantiacum]|uniref:Haloacid dehalogenase superfamily, subfamily IA, variant 3 with third motif having DD or ED n=1 Tax=Cryptosporangium aurantiacum TaxID=134849 RepID=A0A1M7R8N1_9ACTN|nr:HAD family phosphatase [Cryptosporangium aurantiacum]SHN42606.1 haloacid dehalogenase superfamily, subfamily IA, variant 3 with third motif having DD or ED [Cryptosporangium aurantiacum]